MQAYISSLFSIFLLFYPSLFSPFSPPMAAPPTVSLKGLVVFRNCMFKELVRGVHVYGLPGFAEEQVVEREYLFDNPSLGYQEMLCPARIFTAHRFDLYEHYPGTTNGVWDCVFVFHDRINSVLVPKDLSLLRNSKLALIPNLARDIDTIYQLAACGAIADLIEVDTTTEEGSDSQFSGDFGQHSRPLFDLNALPSEAEDEEADPMLSGTKERKFKRAATKDIANISLEELSKYFDVPIIEASKALNVGLTVLKKKCRQFGIPRWPHRKIKSLGTLIHNLQGELEKQQVEDEISVLAVAKRQKMIESEKESIVKKPALEIQQETKKFRQDIFKRKHRARVHGIQSQTLPLF